MHYLLRKLFSKNTNIDENQKQSIGQNTIL